MPELIRPSTILPATREAFQLTTEDGLHLIGEVARPLGKRTATLVTLHPNPTGGGMMDSHIYKKAANRLPHMAGIEIVRFNTRGTASEAGTSEGAYDEGRSEKYDVQAAINYAFDELHGDNVWVVGWSFGTNLAISHARDPRIKGLILLSPTMKWSTQEDLDYWKIDGRDIFALIPEFDEYMNPKQAHERFDSFPNIHQIDVVGAKHLWVGEPMVYRVLSEIVRIVAPDRLPLPEEI